MKIAYALVLASTTLAVAAPVEGQTLEERIAAVKRKRAQQAQRADFSKKTKILQRLLYTELTVSFDQTPARDVFEYLKTALGINVIARYSDDAVGHGIDPETPITLSAEQMIAVEVLDLVLEQCETIEACTWQLRKGFLEVGTRERLSVQAAREIRWYPIDELIYEPPRFTDAISLRLESAYPWSGGYFGGHFGGFPGVYPGSRGGYGGGVQFAPAVPSGSGTQSQRVQSLINLIVELIEPDAWTTNGGNRASIHYRDRALVVNAPDFIHRQIAGYPPVPPPPHAAGEEQPEPADGNNAPHVSPAAAD